MTKRALYIPSSLVSLYYKTSEVLKCLQALQRCKPLRFKRIYWILIENTLLITTFNYKLHRYGYSAIFLNLSVLILGCNVLSNKTSICCSNHELEGSNFPVIITTSSSTSYIHKKWIWKLYSPNHCKIDKSIKLKIQHVERTQPVLSFTRHYAIKNII